MMNAEQALLIEYVEQSGGTVIECLDHKVQADCAGLRLLYELTADGVFIEGQGARSQVATRAEFDAMLVRVRVEGEWWKHDVAVDDAATMLVHAGIIVPADVEYFRSKPWKWLREVAYCNRLEALMQSVNVDPEDGWEMTLAELAQKAVTS